MWLVSIEDYIKRVVVLTIRLVFFALLIRFFVVEAGAVSGASMEPNFRHGDAFLVFKPAYFFRHPDRFDVIQIVHPKRKDEWLVKRVVGLPGETVTIKRNQVCVRSASDEETCLEEPYLSPFALTREPVGESKSWVVPANTFFVLGDNRIYSDDSRDFGSVNRRLIIGKVIPLPL